MNCTFSIISSNVQIMVLAILYNGIIEGIHTTKEVIIMYLVNALIVLAIMALVIPAVLFVAYVIGAATLPPIFDAVNNATPAPAKFQRQKEVFDAYQYITNNHKNLRGHYIWDVQEQYNLSRNEAILRMISEDCNDMGIQINYAYASMLTGVDLDNELRANAKKYQLGFTYETKPLPGQTALAREEASAKLAAEKETAK